MHIERFRFANIQASLYLGSYQSLWSEVNTCETTQQSKTHPNKYEATNFLLSLIYEKRYLFTYVDAGWKRHPLRFLLNELFSMLTNFFLKYTYYTKVNTHSKETSMK